MRATQAISRPGSRTRVVPLPDETFAPVISVPRFYPTLNQIINTVAHTGRCVLSEAEAEQQIAAWRAAS